MVLLITADRLDSDWKIGSDLWKCVFLFASSIPLIYCCRHKTATNCFEHDLDKLIVSQILLRLPVQMLTNLVAEEEYRKDLNVFECMYANPLCKMQKAKHAIANSKLANRLVQSKLC